MDEILRFLEQVSSELAQVVALEQVSYRAISQSLSELTQVRVLEQESYPVLVQLSETVGKAIEPLQKLAQAAASTGQASLAAQAGAAGAAGGTGKAGVAGAASIVGAAGAAGAAGAGGSLSLKNPQSAQAGGGIAGALAPLAAAAGPVGMALGAIAPVIQNVGGKLAGMLGSLKDPMSAVQSVTESLAKGMGGAINALLGPFQQLAGVIGPFVGALNPTLMNVLNQSFRDLQATIGVALVPIAKGLTGIFRQMGGILLPLMQALQPIFANVIQTIANVFLPVLRIWVDVFRSLAPVLEFVTDIFRVISEAMAVYYTVLRTVVQALIEFVKSLFGGVNLKDSLASFRSAMQEITKSLVLLAAYIAKAFGSLGFIDKLIANFEEVAKPKQGAISAPQNAGITSFESISKEFAAAAFVAAGAGGEKERSQLDYIREITESLKDVKNNGKTLSDFLSELERKIEQKMDGLGGEIVAGFLRAIRTLFDGNADSGIHRAARAGQNASAEIHSAAKRLADFLGLPSF